MKTEQILLALRIAREKSITKAAEESFISQPTASNMLKSLENELGYSLFTRTRSGIELTEEGSAFIEYAATIERSLNAISQIKEHPLWLNLRIAALKYDFAELAFEKLCMKHCFGKHTIDFGFQIVGSSEDGTKMVENGLCDVAILMCSKNLYDSAEQKEAKNGLEMAFIANRQIELTCSEGHPIIKDGKIALEQPRARQIPLDQQHKGISAQLAYPGRDQRGLRACIRAPRGHRRLRLRAVPQGFDQQKTYRRIH